jgi:hypothetical protein
MLFTKGLTGCSAARTREALRDTGVNQAAHPGADKEVCHLSYDHLGCVFQVAKQELMVMMSAKLDLHNDLVELLRHADENKVLEAEVEDPGTPEG